MAVVVFKVAFLSSFGASGTVSSAIATPFSFISSKGKKGAANVRKLSRLNPFGKKSAEYPAKVRFTVDIEEY
ncbi:MAG: hypothetical protein ACOX8Q_09670 [Christensenellales bacterium]|jgi:hypothetical protein